MEKVAICEDNSVQQEHLEKLLISSKFNEEFHVKKYSCGEELITAYEKGERFSIIFLDIEMNEMNGIKVAENIRKYSKKCLIIITTSVIEYAVDGYSVDAYDFILKPITNDKLVKVLDKALIEIRSKTNMSYVLISRDTTMAIKHKDIIYIESDKKKVIINTLDSSYTSNENISLVESKLENDGFVRISRYYLVNLFHLKTIKVKTLILSSGEELNYSLKMRDKLKEKYMDYMMGEGI